MKTKTRNKFKEFWSRNHNTQALDLVRVEGFKNFIFGWCEPVKVWDLEKDDYVIDGWRAGCPKEYDESDDTDAVDLGSFSDLHEAMKAVEEANPIGFYV